jgi:hypothetical protein
MLTDHQRKLWEAYEAAEGGDPRGKLPASATAGRDLVLVPHWMMS